MVLCVAGQARQVPDPAQCREVMRGALVGQKYQFLLPPLSALVVTQSVSFSKVPTLPPALFFSPPSHGPAGLKIWLEKSCSPTLDPCWWSELLWEVA